MRRKYLKPPVIEAVCEFRLAPDTQWDTTIPGLIYEKVKKEGFRIKAQGIIPQPTMVATPQGIVQTMRLQQSVRFLTEDNTKFVQVAPGILSINCLRPYPSWEKGFKPLIEKMFDIFSNAAQVDFFQRIGLMYNNRIEIPSPSGHIRLDDYFEFKHF